VKASAVSPAPHPKNPAWQNYYKIAQERNIPLALNSLKHLDLLTQSATPPSAVAIVLGGYHSEGITKFLKAQKYSYEVVTPIVERLGEEQAYVLRMREMAQLAGLDELQLIQRLAVTPFVAQLKSLFQKEANRAIRQYEPRTNSRPISNHFTTAVGRWIRSILRNTLDTLRSLLLGLYVAVYDLNIPGFSPKPNHSSSNPKQNKYVYGPEDEGSTMRSNTGGKGANLFMMWLNGDPGKSARVISPLAYDDHINKHTVPGGRTIKKPCCSLR